MACVLGIYIIYQSSLQQKQKQSDYVGQQIDFDLSMIDTGSASSLRNSKDLLRPMFQTKSSLFLKAKKTPIIKKAPKKLVKKIPFPKFKLVGIVYSKSPKAILLITGKQRIVMEGEKISQWTLTQIFKNELVFHLDQEEKRVSFTAQDFSQGNSSSRRRRSGFSSSSPSNFFR